MHPAHLTGIVEELGPAEAMPVDDAEDVAMPVWAAQTSLSLIGVFRTGAK